MKYEVADLPEGPMNFLADWTVEFFGGRGILWYWFFFLNFSFDIQDISCKLPLIWMIFLALLIGKLVDRSKNFLQKKTIRKFQSIVPRKICGQRTKRNF
jgi:hypothetical protein